VPEAGLGGPGQRIGGVDDLAAPGVGLAQAGVEFLDERPLALRCRTDALDPVQLVGPDQDGLLERAEAVDEGLGDGFGVAPWEGQGQEQFEDFIVGQSTRIVDQPGLEALAMADVVGGVLGWSGMVSTVGAGPWAETGRSVRP